jgi:16S rRNA (cytidine1402-2'-O)-methyltransferase
MSVMLGVGEDVAVSLIVASTPIGNAADASRRLRTALETADVVAAEDTRRVRRLAAQLELAIGGRVVSYYDAVEATRAAELLTELAEGRTVLLVSDAGTPLVSDPGHRLVTAAIAAGFPVSVLPGPSAALAALAVAGLPVDRWCFEGFLPRRAGERRARLAALADEPRTMVFFEAPHRLAATLADLVDSFGADRPGCTCRELTKTYEEIRRGTLGELLAWADAGVRGELTLVVAGASPSPPPPDQQLTRELADLLAAGLSRRDAADALARRHGISRRAVYVLASSL